MTTFLIALATFFLGLILGWYITKTVIERAFERWGNEMRDKVKDQAKEFGNELQ